METPVDKRLPQFVEVILTPTDFKDVTYISNTDCALARALKRLYPDKPIYVYPDYVTIDGWRYELSNEDNDNIMIKCFSEAIDIQPLNIVLEALTEPYEVE